jgi:copper resistance protein B
MRGATLAAVLAATATAAVAQTDPSVHAAHHGGGLYSFALVEADYGRKGGEGVVNWDGEGWIGGDRNKLWWKTEGEVEGGTAKQAELQALYSRNVWTFFDVQAGVRVEVEPATRTYLAAGVQGLAPYLMETELHAFVSDRGDVSVRAKQSLDLRMTNRFILEPLAELNIQLQDVPREGRGAGFERIETGVHARYEITRRFAPYAGLIYERKLGETARIARAAGEGAGGWMLRAGLRAGF